MTRKTSGASARKKMKACCFEEGKRVVNWSDSFVEGGSSRWTKIHERSERDLLNDEIVMGVRGGNRRTVHFGVLW